MFDKEIYIKRREKLRELSGNGLILLLGNEESPMNYLGNTYRFRQDSTFLYFFGIDEPGFSAIIDIDSANDTVFGNDLDIEDIIWMGQQSTVKEKAMQAGVKNTMPLHRLEETIKFAIGQGRKIHFLPPYRTENTLKLCNLTGICQCDISNYTSVDLIKAVISLRSIKDEHEIADIEKMETVAYKMHTTAMKMAKEGTIEKEIAATVEGIALKEGENISFPVILTVNGQILHNHYHGNTLKNGDLLLTDAGAESELHYASDITRTVPVGGKFSQQQAEIYNIVLNANLKAFEMAKPGITYKSIHLEAARVIVEGMKNLGIMKGNTEEAVRKGAHALFFPHGLGHLLGLDVHDMENLGEDYIGYDNVIRRSEQFGLAYLRYAKKLYPGIAITVEPGIYFIPELINLWRSDNKCSDFINYDKVDSYLKFGGIRIEDNILITENGCRLLGKHIPKTVSEIENIMA